MKQTELHSKQDLLAAITSNKEVIKGFGVCNLGLFGSFSKGTFTETSDVDLLVDFSLSKRPLIISWNSPFFWRIFWEEKWN